MTNTPPDDRRALLQSALQAIDDLQEQLDQSRLDAAASTSREPIAIIGVGCRFPGGATTPEAYWQLLSEGRDVVGEYPAERLAMVEASGVDPDTFDDDTTWFGGFLDDIDGFDPQFFGISPREAATMDPQQRLVLEVSWEALERAGVAPDSLNGSATGVFVGITGNEYIQLAKLGGPEALDVYSATGGALNAAPGRVAYTLGLQGPCMAIDTACSSSLVALHQACRSLRSGESDLALAGGVNLLLLPEAFICFDHWGMMASDGRCKTFDAAADGFVRGEGCGMVVLKRLSDAVADGDHVLAVVRGSAVNQDGRSSGLTVPSGLAQQAVIRAALDDADVDPADVQYFEAHGTGTTLGDPIEIEAMGAVLGRGRPTDRQVVIGSVKTNIGHLESASGIAGVIKVVLSMQHGRIPPHLHYHEPSPQIPWPRFPLVVPTETTSWPAVDGHRIAGVSGFGFSGTNAHVVLESPPVTHDDTVGADDTRPRVFTVTARSDDALRDLARDDATWIGDHPDLSFADACATANGGRARLSHRLAVVASSREELVERLDAFVDGGDRPGVVAGTARRPRVAFVFTGQGAQYPGMAKGLYDDEPVFRAALDRCAALIDPGLSEPLLDVIFAEPDSTLSGLLDQTAFTQPALFAVEYAVAELWQSWGVVPDAVLGHSVGEIVAATVAGVFSPEDAARLVVERGALMQALPAGGAMVAVSAPVADVEAELATHDDVAVAAVNGPSHTVVSGSSGAVAQIAAAFDQRGVRVQSLTVSHAFHSPLMRPMLTDFRRVAESIEYRKPPRRLVSNVTGAEAGDEVATADYWVRHVMEPVRFADGIVAMREAGTDVLVEIGPHPVLTSMGAACIPDDGSTTWAPSLRRNRIDGEQILTALGTLFTAGVPVDWSAVRPDGRRRTMPTYPFQRTRCWLDPAPRGRRASSSGHPLLGATTPAPLLDATIHTTTLAVDSPRWLDDHRLSGTVVFPGTAYTELVLAATSPGAGSIESLSILEALVVPDDGEVDLQTVVVDRDGTRQVQVVSLGSDSQRDPTVSVHARATIAPYESTDDPAVSGDRIDLAALVAACPEEVDVDDYYDHLRSIGLTYGPAFRGLSRLVRRDGAAVGLVELSDDVTDAARYRLHPALFDACFHVLGVAVAAPGATASDDMYVPVSIDGLQLHRPGATAAWCAVTLDPDALDSPIAGDGAADADVAADVANRSEPRASYTASLALYSADGSTIATVERLEVRRTPRSMWQRALGAAHDPVYELTWSAAPRTDEADEVRDWLIVGAQTAGCGADVVSGLVSSGASVELVEASADDQDVQGAIAQVIERASSAVGVVYLGGFDDDSDDDLDGWLAGALTVTQALAEHPAADARLWFVTAGAQTVEGEPSSTAGAALWGFGRVVANELPGLGATCIDLDASDGPDAGELVDELLHADREDQVAIRSGHRSVARLTHAVPDASALPDVPYRLTLDGRGSFEFLGHAPLDRRNPGPGEVEIELRATGLNFRDVLNVLDMYPGDPGAPGLECSGVVSAVGPGVDELAVGDAVVGIAPNAFDSHVVTRADLVVRAPERLTFAEAATLPIAYLTAAYGLRRLADLRAGERVLIHAGAGGVGMAAIHIAQRLGAEVYTTVGSPAKRRVLEDLGVRHIYGSRTLDFAEQILADTDGAGVDVVLNSLSDEFIDQSFRVLAPTGRFLEIGKRGIWTVEQARAERPDGRYHVYDLADFLGDDGGLRDLLQEVVNDISAHRAEPLPLRAFTADRVEHAFRFMAQARHIGKVVVTHRPTGSQITDDGAYVVTGGLGGLGLVVAAWLVERGARHVTLAGRRAPSDDAAAVIAELRGAGATVTVVQADVADAADVERLLAAAMADGLALRGVVHAAGITDDGALGQQTPERFKRVLAPKVFGATLLDRATRTLDLDHFVLFSSASAVLGAPGQSSYAAANSAMDAIARSRRAAGLPGISINWGAWASVGMAARLDDRQRDQIAGRGVGELDPAHALEVMQRLLGQSGAQVAALSVDWPTMFANLPEVPPLLSALAESRPSTGSTSTRRDLVAELLALDVEQRLGHVRDAVAEQVTAVLGLDPRENIDAARGFSELGMDSLMAVELSNRLSAVLDRSVPSTLPFEFPTLEELVVHATEILSDRVDVVGAAPGQQDTAIHAAAPVVDLAPDDVEDALLRELDDAGY